jgi:predicted enzyme related to lactoylglutathione lyase
MEDMLANNPGIDKSILFIYFNDLPKAMAFYEDVMGFNLEIDQGWCKIYRTSASGFVGLVDGNRGYHKASETKPMILCFRVPDVEAWHSRIVDKGIEIHHPLKNNEELKIRAFLFNDPEGHVIEIQSTL